MLVREKIEKNEKIMLQSCAAFASESRGRAREDKIDDIRTCFMVDRDRIIHSKSFRRLKHKTQVYISSFGDHYRTRLTHTLEVAQIAKTIGRGIGLNEDLIEAIALGHDIGHVAFAHNGEEVLNKLLPKGFRHNENSVRVLTKIEKQGLGLNLSCEVLDGIRHHSGLSKEGAKAFTLEGQVVRYSDKIAYVNHDIDDSVRAELLKEGDIPKESMMVLGENHSQRINTLVTSCIYNTLNNIEKGNIKVSLEKDIEDALYYLRDFLFENVYKGKVLKVERDKAKFVLEQVFLYFYKFPEKMPEFYIKIVEDEGLHQGVADYISGMSDDYCLSVFNNIYVPKIVIY